LKNRFTVWSKEALPETKSCQISGPVRKKSEGFPLACSKRDAGIEIGKQYLESKYPLLQSKGDYPFCYERCRTIDLGAWLDGQYVI